MNEIIPVHFLEGKLLQSDAKILSAKTVQQQPTQSPLGGITIEFKGNGFSIFLDIARSDNGAPSNTLKIQANDYPPNVANLSMNGEAATSGIAHTYAKNSEKDYSGFVCAAFGEGADKKIIWFEYAFTDTH